MMFNSLRNGRNTWGRRKSSRRYQGRTSRRMRSAPLSLERLEQRTLLSVVPISNSSRSNDYSFPLLVLRFDDTEFRGESGETPNLIPDGANPRPRTIRGGMHAMDIGNLVYDTAGNITSTAGTVEFWFNPDWNGNDNQSHVFFEAGDQFNNGILIAKDAANNFRFLQ